MNMEDLLRTTRMLTRWVNPKTKKALNKKEYNRLAKQASRKEIETREYLMSLGYIRYE